MAFVKLDTGILNSTVWPDRDVRDVFLTALLMAEPRVYDDPVPTYRVRSTEAAGWSVPPGWYGFVPAAGPALIAKAGIPDAEAGLTALEVLGDPDPHSRSPEFDGRRMVRIDGGYLLLNFQKYRDRDHGAAQRMRRWRQRQKEAPIGNPPPTTAPVSSVGNSPVTANVTGVTEVTPERPSRTPPVTPNVTQAEAEAEAEAEKEVTTERAGRPGGPGALLEKFPAEYWGDIETALGAAPNAYALACELRAILDGMPGHGPQLEPAALGRAVREVLLAGGPITGFRIQVMHRGRQRVNEDPPARPGKPEPDDEFTRAARELARERRTP